MRICVGLLACLTFYSSTAESATGTSDMDKNKLDELFAKIDPVKKFKQGVDFDQLVNLEDPHTRVCANWQQFSLAPVAQGLKVTGPVASITKLAHGKHRERFEWELSSGPNEVSVDVIDAITAQGARKRFMINAEGNSMMEIPYVKGPANVGTVSAMSKNIGDGHTQLFWIYRNMYFEINVRGNFDRLLLARFIQEHAEKNLQAVP
jgi:hypothetical protein